jgi:hypothetical protein
VEIFHRGTTRDKIGAFAVCSRISIRIYSRKSDFEDAGARQGIILASKLGLPIMNFLSGDGVSMRLGP